NAHFTRVSMNVSLPPELASAIEQRLEGVSRKELAARAKAFSETYREGGTSRVIGDRLDVLAYLVARLPATFAATTAAFQAAPETLTGFSPASLLDAGAGTGAASWAASSLWPSLRAVTMLDRNANLLDMAHELAPRADASFIEGDLSGALPAADLVVASYVLAELPEAEIAGHA